MLYNPEIHHKTSIRWPQYDYGKPGFYFVTIRTKNHQCIFGDINNGVIKLSPMGKIVREEWLHTPIIRPYVKLDEYVIMPNHVHGIIIINENNICQETPIGIDSYQSLQFLPHQLVNSKPPSWHRFGPQSHNLFAIVKGFKAAVTKLVNQRFNQSSGSIWQSRFYDHVIRDENELYEIRKYIKENHKQ